MTEAVLVIGRSRRLVNWKVEPASPPVAQSSAAPPPRQAVPATPPPVLAPQAAAMQAPRYQNRRLRSLDASKDIEDKCEALLKWLGRVDEEYPERASNRFAFSTEAIYLYRDEDFVQVFGQPFDQTSTKFRMEVHEKVIRRCQGYTPPPGAAARFGVRKGPLLAFANQFRPFSQVLDGPFLGAEGPYSPPQVTAAVVRAREARAGLERSLQQWFSSEPTLETFRSLGGANPAGGGGRRGMLVAGGDALWPSERKFLTEAAAARRATVAGQVAQQWLAAIPAAGTTFEDARRLEGELQARQDLVRALDGPLGHKVSDQVHAKVDSILNPWMNERVAQLEAIPGTLAGVTQAAGWQAAVLQELQPFAERPAAARAQQAYSNNRSRILTAALAEWKQATGVADPTEEQIQQLAASLKSLFPQGNRESLYPQYEQALTAAVDQRKQRVVADATSRCDRQAAHPQDPEAIAAGTADEKLRPADVIAACELAVQQQAPPPRLHFQLARAYILEDRMEEAVEHLTAAAEEGHGAALAYLADVCMDGAPGIEADPGLAHSLYEKAAAAGFAPAKTVLAKFQDMTKEAAEADAQDEKALAEIRASHPELFTQLDAPDGPPPPPLNTKYIHPEILDNIEQGSLDAIPTPEFYTKTYLLNVAENIGDFCEGNPFTGREVQSLKTEAVLRHVPPTPQTGMNALIGGMMIMGSMLKNPEAYLRSVSARSYDTEQVPIEAMKDAYAFIARHPCGSPEYEPLKKHLVAYVMNEGAPLASSDDLFRKCSREARPTGKYDAPNFCTCFVPVLTAAPITRENRKNLSTNFWPTAQKIIAADPTRYGFCTQ